MKFKKTQKRNPQDPEGPKKYYATPISSGKVSLDDLSNRIARSSSLTRGDVLNVISCLLDEIPECLKDGKSVQLGDLATIRPSFSSTGADTEDEVTANQIKKVKIIFTPSVKLKEELKRMPFAEYKA